MSAPSDHIESAGFETYIANRKFHRVFHLPPNQSQGRSQSLRITYADYGYQDDAGLRNEAVILVCGPMISTRYLHIAKDALARERKVRIIHPDRFGFGGSGEIAADQRIRVWLELVPALLQHLNIKHISVMAQSGGTIYALNLILFHPQLLHPTQPYIALGAPWVHPSRSGATAMQLMKIFPNGVFSNLDSVALWFRDNIAPVTGFSENIIGTIGASVSSLFSIQASHNQSESVLDNEASFVFDEEIRPVVVDLAYVENVQGLSQEALLFLKRGNAHDWGPWEDYDRYVPMLADAQKSYRKPDSNSRKLKVDVFFAEADIMIGESAGPKWFDECWRESSHGPDIEYQSQFVKGADHDGIFNLRWGVVEKIFTEVRSRSVGS
ncbi:hypothetical protein N431DRAFT_539622 [Stipitochalara longipes BDJ]|nr:hypothetical protein N431DRAFT_539622 [Stipitochalara longipes BDJ]